MLSELQQRLTDINGVEPGHDIRDYLITDRVLAETLGQGQLLTTTDETVLVAEDNEGMALSVYLDQAMLDRLDSEGPLTRLRADLLADFWTVLEGISHFNYLAWSAARDRSVTLLELEMQAEVDKFVASLMLAMEQGEEKMLGLLHGLLFESCSFNSELSGEQLARYRAANEYAARFCHRLREGVIDGCPDARSELRRFYRLSQSGKISHIHTRAWADA